MAEKAWNLYKSKRMLGPLSDKRICSLSELKMLCEDAERYAALDDALFLYSEERSEKNYLKQEILDTLTNITKRYKNKNKENEEKNYEY